MVSFVRFLRRTFGRRHRSDPTPSFEERSPDNAAAPAEPMKRWYSLRTRRKRKVGDLEAGNERQRSGTFRRSWSLRLSKRRSHSKSGSTSPAASSSDPASPKVDSTRSDGDTVIDSSNCSRANVTAQAADGSEASCAQSNPPIIVVQDCTAADSQSNGEVLCVPAERCSMAEEEEDRKGVVIAEEEEEDVSGAAVASPVPGEEACATKTSHCRQEGGDRETDAEDATANSPTCSTPSSLQDEQAVDPSKKMTVEVSVEGSRDAVIIDEPTATRDSSSPCSEDLEVASESDGSDLFVVSKKIEIAVDSDVVVSPVSSSTPSSVRARVLELEALSVGTPPLPSSNRFSMCDVQVSPSPGLVPKQRSRSESDARDDGASPDGNGKTVRFETDKKGSSKKRKWGRKESKKKKSSGGDEAVTSTELAVTRGSVWRWSGRRRAAPTCEGGSEAKEEEKADRKKSHVKRFFKVKRSQSEKVKSSHESTDGGAQPKSASRATVSKDDLDIRREQLSTSVQSEPIQRHSAIFNKSLQLDDCKYLYIIAT